MEPRNLFEDLVDYHLTRNLEKCLPFIDDGRIISPTTKRSFRQGTGENKIYGGILLVSDGNRLMEALIRDGRVKQHPDYLSGFERIEGTDGFAAYFDSLTPPGDDPTIEGAFIYDSLERKIARAYEIGNMNNDGFLHKLWRQFTSLFGYNPEQRSFSDDLPSDFCSDDGSVPVCGESVGTRTRRAIDLPQTYARINAQGYQIKQQPYTNLGMGKVTHFNKDGLAEEFFLMHEPSSISSDNPHGLTGVYRAYTRQDGKLARAQEIRNPLPILYERDGYKLGAILAQPYTSQQRNAA